MGSKLRSPVMLALAAGFALLVAFVLLAKPLGCVKTRMTVAEYAEHDREGSMRTFVVTGRLRGRRPTGGHVSRVGNVELYWSGGLELTTPDGRTLHELKLEGPDGETGRFYFDPAKVTVPESGSEVEVRGAFETITIFRQYGPPADLSFGIVRRIDVLSPPPLEL